ncbi:signal peptidase I [Candidatus Uhrbacteria bacterium]|nr:signal peptidase I [Candidatus Uhrbacteria bacterium]
MSSRFSQFEDKLYERFGPVGGAVAAFLLEVVQIVVISSAIIFPIRLLIIQPFYVKGASMEPNFYDHEYLIIDEVTYRFREPMRGEIVVFKYPRDDTQYFIKRVVALPGETVEVTNGSITIYNVEHPNGLVLEEAYLQEQTTGKARVTLGEDEYYVLGDNRDSSLDSRSFGPVARKFVTGRVWVRGLPLSRIGTFDVPIYNL